MISGNALKARGWVEGRLLGLAKKAGAALLAADPQRDKDGVLDLLDAVRADAAHYQGHVVLGDLAAALVAAQEVMRLPAVDALRTAPLPYAIWGEGIDQAARAQMDVALRLPVSLAGALMPDAHSGYGLPIGGVLATVGAVIPYAVGSDIACRMRLSVYEVGPEALDDTHTGATLARALIENTAFGPGGGLAGTTAGRSRRAGGPGLGCDTLALLAAGTRRGAVGHEWLGQSLRGVGDANPVDE